MAALAAGVYSLKVLRIEKCADKLNRDGPAVEPSVSFAPSISPATADRIVFNIKGNSYRLVVAVDFEKSIVWIKWIGTHRDYDKIDVKEVQYED
jgi:hypothetical protein